MKDPEVLVVERRFHGPENSGNGGYVCGRIARYIGESARVRLRVPPPLDVPMEVSQGQGKVSLIHEDELIAEGWPAPALDLEIPPPPVPDIAELASKDFAGFRTHRFASCFVCGPERSPETGLRLFAGPVPGRDLVACTWTPAAWLSPTADTVPLEFMWATLDCPGGFSFPHPSEGTILLGELSATIQAPAKIGERHVVVGWQLEVDGRKHHTGTAIFSKSNVCLGRARGIWFEVPELD